MLQQAPGLRARSEVSEVVSCAGYKHGLLVPSHIPRALVAVHSAGCSPYLVVGPSV